MRQTQVSLTDPDARAMATNGKGSGRVGYNVQTVVDAKHHLIIAHEVTNVGHDKHQLANMARQAKEVTGANGLTVLADRGYFSGEEVVACEAAGATPIVRKPLTSGAKPDWHIEDLREIFDARRATASDAAAASSPDCSGGFFADRSNVRNRTNTDLNKGKILLIR